MQLIPPAPQLVIVKSGAREPVSDSATTHWPPLSRPLTVPSRRHFLPVQRNTRTRVSGHPASVCLPVHASETASHNRPCRDVTLLAPKPQTRFGRSCAINDLAAFRGS